MVGTFREDSIHHAVSADGSRVFWWTVLGLTLSAGWVEILGLLVADKATEGGAVDTINSILSGTPLAALAMIAIGIGTVAVNAMNDYTGSLSLQAAGIRVPRVYSAIVVAVLGFGVTLWLNSENLVGKIAGGRLLVTEIMGSSMRTRESLLYGETENRTFQEIIEAGGTMGWHSFDQSLLQAFKDEIITAETAITFCAHKNKMRRDIEMSVKLRDLLHDVPSGLRLQVDEPDLAFA